MSSINIAGDLMDLNYPRIMGIINATPDSFFKNSRIENIASLEKQVLNMIEHGVDILDIGAYSSRPGADHISLEEEIKRLIPFVEFVSQNFPQLAISVDTFRSEVAEKAVAKGAGIINDISAGSLDKNMFKTVAQLQVPYVIMHMRGNPQNMQSNTNYQHLINDVILYFSEKIDQLHSLGVNDIIVDPGFGFSKTLDQNFELLKDLELLKILEKSILVGVSRKSMIHKFLDIDAQQALNGTSVLNTIALQKGASILRVHDVKEAKQAVKLYCKTFNI